MEKNKKISISFNIIAIICIIIFCFAITPKTLQNDTFYTIKIGEHILQNGIDMQDPFSWHENLSYTYPHWLYDVGTYLVYHNFGGMMGIYITTFILTSILGLVIYFSQLKLSRNQLISFILTISEMYLLIPYIAARAQLVTFILFVLTILFIEQFLETKKIGYAIGLIIIPIIIANVHCAVWPFYFVLYLPYIAEYLLCTFLDSNIINKSSIKSLNKKIEKLKSKSGKEDKIKKLEDKLEKVTSDSVSYERKLKEVKENPYKIKLERRNAGKWLILIMVISILTGLCTPLGDTPYTYLIKTMQGNTTHSISEHLPLTLANHTNVIITFVIFLVILMFTDTKIKLKDLFMLSGLVILTFMSRRQFSMLVIVCGFILNRLLCSIFNKYIPKAEEISLVNKILLKILIVGIIIGASVYLYKDKIDNEFINPSAYPVEAANYIKKNLDYKNIKLFNDYNYGSYLLYQDIPVFIDSRADLYAPEFSGWDKDIFTDFLDISGFSVDYNEKFEDYGVTHIITYYNSKLAKLLMMDNKYKEIYKDDNFIIFERLLDNK